MRNSRLLMCSIACLLPTSPVIAQQDILYMAKMATNPAKDFNESLNLWKQTAKNSRHVFLLKRMDVAEGPASAGAGSGVISIEKPSGSLRVFGTVKFNNDVQWTAQTTLPLDKDFQLIASLYPRLKETMSDSADSEEKMRTRILTTWYFLRFQAADIDMDPFHAKEFAFTPLTQKNFMSLYAQLGYVEIHSKPDGATITIIGHHGWGKTDDSGYLPDGNVTIHLEKDGCKELHVTEKIKRKGPNKFLYKLACD